MITYKDASNANDYTLLFNTASMKLGLIPIEKAVLDELGDPVLDEAGNPTYSYSRMVWKEESNKWEEVELSANDMDADHNIVISDGNGGTITLHGISTLNEYFQHISELAALAMGPLDDTRSEDIRHGTDPYFLRLPLDEPYFEINANTRAITVPSALSQIGVVGDKYAEIVFFKIDRYFDAIDLDTRHIYIEWEAPGANGETIKGISRDFLRDTQSEKDKIIFGWLIDDRLTQAVGTIRFAVRFVEWTSSEDSAAEGEQLAYSFSSLPAQISVVDSLHYDLFDGADDKDWTAVSNQKIRNMQLFFENSVPDAEDSTQPVEAEAPVFIRDINNFESWDVIDETLYKHDLVGEANIASLELITEAYSPDAGNLSYVYAYKKDAESGSEAIATRVIFKKFVLTTAIPANNHTVYYKIKDGTTDTYELASVDELNEAVALNGSVEVYEKVARTVVAKPGYYYAIARNTAAAKKTGRAESKKVYVPYPEPFTVDEEHPMPKYFVLEKMDYSIAPNTEEAQSTTSNLVVTRVPAEDHASSITLGGDVYGPKFVAPAEGSSAVSYQWFKDGVELSSEGTLSVSAPGVYSVKVTNVHNNETAVLTPEEVGSITVLNMPSEPELDFDAWATVVQAGDLSTAIPVVEPEDGGVLAYEWHRVTTNQRDLDEVADGYMESPTGIVTDGTIPFKPLQIGFFYLILRHRFVDEDNNVLAESIVNCGTKYGVIQVDTDTPRYEVSFVSEPDVETYSAEILATLPQISSVIAPTGEFTPETPEDVVIENLGTWKFVSWDAASKAISNTNISFTATWTFEAAASEDDTPESL